MLKNLLAGGDIEELKKALDNNAFIVDVRSPGEFASGSVPGAKNIPLDVVGQQLKQFKGKEYIVVFCKSGMRSGQAKGILEDNGFENVVNGINAQNVMSAMK